MAYTEKKIDTIASFVRHLSKDRERYKGTIWFRGQSESDWPLLPGYIRLKNAPPESKLLNRFKQSAAMLAEFEPKNSLDWLMLMQHYGAPTRLLDWTENPMMGLYFALNSRENHKGKDAALWLLKPSEINKYAGVYDENDPYYIPSFQDEELKAYSIEYIKQVPNVQQMPIAANAVRNNSRIQAQSGVFTIHHFIRTALEEIGDGKHVIKYRIPADKKDNLAKQLDVLGLKKFHVFPELATIGEMIKDEFK